jgi:antitoxin component YwqK of YwqJK toxin-antitoxin module
LSFNYFVLFIFVIILQSCAINKYDKQGNRKGKWKIYWDDTQLQSQGKYKEGWQKGVWKYYDQQGHLAQKQTHHKDKTIDIVYYFPNGKIESKGKARIKEDEKGDIQFFWYNQWLFYNADGSFKTEKYYLEGQVMEVEEFTK